MPGINGRQVQQEAHLMLEPETWCVYKRGLYTSALPATHRFALVCLLSGLLFRSQTAHGSLFRRGRAKPGLLCSLGD